MISYYELLKKVEEGDIPEKIKVHLTPRTSRIYTADYDGSSFSHYFIDGDTNEEYHHYLSECFLESDMFDKNIEIIEEEKKIPEKLSTWFSLEMSHNKELNREYANTNFENMYEKINEICDYLKSKGSDKE